MKSFESTKTKPLFCWLSGKQKGMYAALLAIIASTMLANSVMETAADPPDTSRIGFAASRWGSLQWTFMHILALNLPPSFGVAVRNFEAYIYSLQKVLPCKECRDEFKEVLRVIPPRPFLKEGRIGAVAWVYTAHCIVSSRVKPAACTVKFLEKERLFLQNYVKPESIDIELEMGRLEAAAATTRIDLSIQAALIKWQQYKAEKAA